jgi:hypothetical protein
VFHGIDTKQAKEEISHVQLHEKLFLSQSTKLLCFESFHNRTGTVSQTMHILRDDITEKQQQSTLYKLADLPNTKRMPSTLSIATARPLAQLTAGLPDISKTAGIDVTHEQMRFNMLWWAANRDNGATIATDVQFGIKVGSDPTKFFTTRIPSGLGDNFLVCLTNVVHGVYGVQYKFCEIRVNFVKLNSTEKYDQSRKIQDGDRIEINYIPGLKGGADSPPTKKEEEKTVRRLIPIVRSPPPLPVQSSASPPPLPRGLLPYADSDASSMDDEDGPTEDISSLTVLDALSESLRMARTKRKLNEGFTVPSDNHTPRRLINTFFDVSYSSGDSSKEVSASSMSSETAHKQAKKYDSRNNHRQSLQNAIRIYDFYLEYYKHRQEVHLEQLLHLTEIRNVCVAYLNLRRPIGNQRKEIRKRLNRIPKVHESCIYARMKKTFNTFTTEREEDQDSDHG